ncbi:hypothetical protein [Actinobaculum sp. 352]|uniref:hypothetical protein n=1 Tax=Actinobaculum sp. 352 TaxID=2490946 RepID=UPI000F7F903A|nr:hypothetical protein [Actinobaculum sp. 352]RTE47892.1 hypothetical protein EKN07_11575 [Actinobaculum sp. 352]
MISHTDVIDAVATRLATAHIAAWDGPDRPLPDNGLPPVFVKRLQATPDTAFAVNVYNMTLSPDPSLPGQVAYVQIRTRAPYDADPLADMAAAALHGVHAESWTGTVRVGRCRHLSTAQLGADPDTLLDERTDNYEIHLSTN